MNLLCKTIHKESLKHSSEVYTCQRDLEKPDCISCIGYKTPLHLLSRKKGGVLDMILTCMWWWAFIPEDLGSV